MQALLYADVGIDRKNFLKAMLATEDEAGIGHLVEVDSNYQNNTKEKKLLSFRFVQSLKNLIFYLSKTSWKKLVHTIAIQ